MFNNCTFTSNSAVGASRGGAVYIDNDGSGEFIKCKFTSNKAVPNVGGAIRIGKFGTGIFDTCNFTKNHASRGGAAFIEGRLLLLGDYIFSQNEPDHLLNAGGYLALTCLPGERSSVSDSGKVSVSTFKGCPDKCKAGTCEWNGNGSRVYSVPSGTCAKEGMSFPQICPAGRFGSGLELTQVNCSGPCNPGYYCPAGSKSPAEIPCPLGRFVTESGSSSVKNCMECPAGSYCELAAIFARPCPARHYGNRSGLGSSLCSGLCPAGTFCVSGTIVPIVCPPGSFSAKGSHDCTGCPVGYATINKGSHRCHICSKGSFAPSERTVECISCFPGRFQNESGQASCHHCFQGTFSDKPGMSQCRRASFGHEISDNRTYQVSCPAGKFLSADQSVLSAQLEGTRIRKYVPLKAVSQAIMCSTK